MDWLDPNTDCGPLQPDSTKAILNEEIDVVQNEKQYKVMLKS